MLSEDQVRNIAKLARIGLTDDEVRKFAGQMSGVLDYVNMLDKVDTDGVQETSQVTGLSNVIGSDELKVGGCAPDELLNCTELPLESHQIKVKKTI